MKYKYIIQELKESGDPNVLAFLKDAEKIKRMAKKERDYCLQNRWMYESVKKLVEEFIPYIIMVAYGHQNRTKTLTVLDLINEGILGAYAAFEKSPVGEVLTRKRVDKRIKWCIKSAVLKDYNQGFADVAYDECMSGVEDWKDENDLIEDINGEWLRLHLTSVIMENMGERDGGIIIDYYLGEDADLKEIAEKYGVSKERARQITRNFSKLYKKAENLKSIRQL